MHSALGVHGGFRLLSPKISAHHRNHSLCSRFVAYRAARDQPQRADSEDDDPVEAMMWVAQNEMNMNVVWVDPDEDEEDLVDALEDLEDVWMRNPAPPEWAEATGLTQALADINNGTTSSSTAADPSRGLTTVTWAELQQQLQHGQQSAVILQINVPPDDSEPAVRSLPDPLPWASTLPTSSVQQVSLDLTEVTREAAAASQGKTVAVVDTGHHSCLAAAIRLSAVYRVPDVLLLQADA